jgi:hypothetical protein
MNYLLKMISLARKTEHIKIPERNFFDSLGCNPQFGYSPSMLLSLLA